MATSERWQQVERLYHAALARDARDRAAFLRDECAGDRELLREVESFLAYDSTAGALLAGHAIDALAESPIPGESSDRLIGQRLGPYAITTWLGSGGMGDVYRARDARLGRDVAIKILPDVFAVDSARRARFEREARVLAALNHTNIASIYGFEDRDGIHALVLELVDGLTLAERLRAGPLPIREALGLASQIARALQAAHDKGIVHRDLKPRNIALTQEGAVKVLDFGLAKAAFDEGSSVGSAAGETGSGAMLGTTQYMSPEQARGRAVDRQADVWAFGCVLFEMLAGRPAFGGVTVADTLAAILDSEPEWNALPRDTPPSIVRLAKRCLEKDRAQRVRDIADARLEIEDTLHDRAVAITPALARPRRRSWIVAGGVAAAVLIAIALAALYRARELPAPTRLSVSAPGTLAPQLSAAISPDGRRLAFVATGTSGRLKLWIRDLDSLQPRVLAGTEDAAHAFWSPDGRRLGFLADGKVRTIAATGGPVETLADTPLRAGPSWGSRGQILFISRSGEIGMVPADGGPVSTVVAMGPDRRASWPQFLPDGQHFLFWVSSDRADERGVYVGAVGSSSFKRILGSESKAAYADGHVLFVRNETLMAQPFDLTRLELTGRPIRIADGVWTAPGAGQASFSVSSAGTLAYVNASTTHRQLAWFDRRGRPLEQVGDPARYDGAFQLAPDGRTIVAARGAQGGEQLWLLDSTTNRASRIALTLGRQADPVWSADGARIALQVHGEKSAVYVTNVDGSGTSGPFYESDRLFIVADWSPDGRFLVLMAKGPESLSDLWLLPLTGDSRVTPYLRTRFNKTQAQISPDGRWLAYTTYESGADEVYVDSFPVPGNRHQVSGHGGAQPRWRADGRELFYVAPDQVLMATPVEADRSIQFGEPAPLFKLGVVPHGSQSIGLATLYDVAPDGQRFLTVVPPAGSDAPITVVLNWTTALHTSDLPARR